jgi:hypothetical protein
MSSATRPTELPTAPPDLTDAKDQAKNCDNTSRVSE